MKAINAILEVEIGVVGGEEDGVSHDINEHLYTTLDDAIADRRGARPRRERPLHGRAHLRQRARRLQAGQRQAAARAAEEIQDGLAAKYGTGPKPLDLVFHGGSGSTDAEIAEAVANGVVKMNIDTDTQYAFTRSIAGLHVQELRRRAQGRRRGGQQEGLRPARLGQGRRDRAWPPASSRRRSSSARPDTPASNTRRRPGLPLPRPPFHIAGRTASWPTTTNNPTSDRARSSASSRPRAGSGIHLRTRTGSTLRDPWTTLRPRMPAAGDTASSDRTLPRIRRPRLRRRRSHSVGTASVDPLHPRGRGSAVHGAAVPAAGEPSSAAHPAEARRAPLERRLDDRAADRRIPRDVLLDRCHQRLPRRRSSSCTPTRTSGTTSPHPPSRAS